jgi:hypothetical protein
MQAQHALLPPVSQGYFFPMPGKIPCIRKPQEHLRFLRFEKPVLLL